MRGMRALATAAARCNGVGTFKESLCLGSGRSTLTRALLARPHDLSAGVAWLRPGLGCRRGIESNAIWGVRLSRSKTSQNNNNNDGASAATGSRMDRVRPQLRDEMVKWDKLELNMWLKQVKGITEETEKRVLMSGLTGSKLATDVDDAHLAEIGVSCAVQRRTVLQAFLTVDDESDGSAVPAGAIYLNSAVHSHAHPLTLTYPHAHSPTPTPTHTFHTSTVPHTRTQLPTHTHPPTHKLSPSIDMHMSMWWAVELTHACGECCRTCSSHTMRLYLHHMI